MFDSVIIITIFHLEEFTLEVNAYNDINISNIGTDTANISTQNTTTSSLFNSLIAQNIDKKETESSTQSLKDRVKDAIDNIENVISTSSDTSNTHDELTLMLALKNMQAS